MCHITICIVPALMLAGVIRAMLATVAYQGMPSAQESFATYIEPRFCTASMRLTVVRRARMRCTLRERLAVRMVGSI